MTRDRPPGYRYGRAFHRGQSLTGRSTRPEPNIQGVPVRTPEGDAIRDAIIAERETIRAFHHGSGARPSPVVRQTDSPATYTPRRFRRDPWAR